MKELEIKKTEFYTYKPKTERGFKVILRGMHPSIDTEELKLELHALGHEVTNIWNVKKRNSNQPLPLFEIELKTDTNNKNIYSVKTLMCSRINFEPSKPKKTIPQCSNCQQYGHTRSFCRRNPKCIKCAGNHHSKSCERKNWSDQVKCALCSGNHPANYKGCQIFKQIQKIHKPPLRNREVLPSNTEQSSENRQEQRPQNTDLPCPTNATGNISYANVTRNPYSNFPPENASHSQQQPAIQNVQPIIQPSAPNQMSEMLNMLNKLMQQMSNLIMNITSKFIQNGLP